MEKFKIFLINVGGMIFLGLWLFIVVKIALRWVSKSQKELNVMYEKINLGDELIHLEQNVDNRYQVVKKMSENIVVKEQYENGSFSREFNIKNSDLYRYRLISKEKGNK